MIALVVLSSFMAVTLATPGYPGLLAGGLAAPGLLHGGLAAPGLLPGGIAAHGLLAAGIAGHSAGFIPGGPANIVIGPGGTPLDTPAVAAAKGAHLAAVAETRARDSAINGPAVAGLVAAPGGIASPLLGYAAHAPANIVIGPGGVPLDTPEVAAGKVANAVAHLEAKARNGVIHG